MGKGGELPLPNDTWRSAFNLYVDIQLFFPHGTCRYGPNMTRKVNYDTQEGQVDLWLYFSNL